MAIAIIVSIVAVGGSLATMIHGYRNGIGVLIGVTAISFSLLSLRYVLRRSVALGTRPDRATRLVLLAGFTKLPITLGLLALAVWFTGKQIDILSLTILLVYFALVFGVFARENQDSNRSS